MNNKIKLCLIKQLNNEIRKYKNNVKGFYNQKELKQDYKLFRKVALKIQNSKKLKSFYLYNY